MDFQGYLDVWKWQVACLFFLCSWGWVSGQLQYSLIEESDPGTVVGYLAKDLGFNLADIYKRRLSLGSEGHGAYFAADQKNGILTVKERIDRENICGSSTHCILHLEVVAEEPLELFSLEIEIVDVNDNSPTFSAGNQRIKIIELVTSPGVRFPLEIAQDQDVGSNSITHYALNKNPYFSLFVETQKDGTLVPKLVLEKILDREENQEHKLILTAFDGGEKPRSGSSEIIVTVLDINDNAPQFYQSVYKISIVENLPLKTIVIALNATDLDDGANGEIIYSFDHHTVDKIKKTFDLNSLTGEIFIKGAVDYEESQFYELSVRAIDKGVPELEGRCIVQIDILDVNDNTPEIIFTSKTNEVPENVAIGTIVGFITVKDKDSGKNGEIQLEVPADLPFKCQPFKNRYTLVTTGYLDRENASKYAIQLGASDLGSPSLHTQTIIYLSVSDVNDNSPAFKQSVYKAFIRENNDPGSLLCTVSASDPDEGDNAKLKYSIIESQIDGSSVSSFVYINPDNGNIYAQRSFDYEQFQVLEITASVEDSGSPNLSSNVLVFIFILDTNDNYPSVLYPGNLGELSTKERIPISASVGYLVTKVSAVDLDSGHNALIAYGLDEPSDPSLFQVSEYTGEIRTLRAIQETDSTEQHLVIVVRDHGEPSLSTTVPIVINIIDDMAQEMHKSRHFPINTKPTSDVTLYLIISLVAISLVSLVTFIILIVKCFRKEHDESSCGFCFPNKTYSKAYADKYQPTLYLNTDGTLKYMEVRMAPPEPQAQCYSVCFPPATEKSDFTLTKPLNFPHLTDIDKETDHSSDPSWLKEPNKAQPNTEWRFSQAQRPGPSGAQPTEEAGVWPNNQFETERLQAMILASANEAAEGTSGLGGGTGTMGLSARYGPQFTLQHVPDYRQNVYIPGSTLTPTNAAGKRDGKSGGNKKKSGKKEKK
ncbi:protocadherin gamma-C5-like isoform X5 [Spea bombifrons]|uniref:protocadherin gamma-C5-like isoform X5 n=1 Tax=Spea bombifrons TaxID=233779 RepID=UPI00234A1954|nr:protocadherin gamma-C5-like isoform X5 [Spea bombifrons]